MKQNQEKNSQARLSCFENESSEYNTSLTNKFIEKL